MLERFQSEPANAPWWAEHKAGLSDQQIANLLAYLETLRTEVADKPTDGSDAAIGQD
jgi:cytochrome c553